MHHTVQNLYNIHNKINSKKHGPFDIILNYRHTGKYVDYDGSKNSKQKSTDLINLLIKKNLSGNTISLNLKNLLNERYEKPATYSQDGRKINFSFRKMY